jgi:hypothetical protein
LGIKLKLANFLCFLNGGGSLQPQSDLISHLYEGVRRAIGEYGKNDWGYNVQENWGFVLDVRAIVTVQSNVGLHLLDATVKETGIEMQVAVDKDTITSSGELTHAVYQFLNLVAESFLVILPKHSPESVKYWFATGSASHGHVGEIIIDRKHISHFDECMLSYLE